MDNRNMRGSSDKAHQARARCHHPATCLARRLKWIAYNFTGSILISLNPHMAVSYEETKRHT
eukprot:scaffold555346_cov17-Prasinocladus_malaysianus.AAC.1